MSDGANARYGSKCEELNLSKFGLPCLGERTSVRCAATSVMGHQRTSSAGDTSEKCQPRTWARRARRTCRPPPGAQREALLRNRRTHNWVADLTGIAAAEVRDAFFTERPRASRGWSRTLRGRPAHHSMRHAQFGIVFSEIQLR